jgi:hypothetical protein
VKYFVGCDPDIHNLSVAIIDETCKIKALYLIKEKGKKDKEAVKQLLASLHKISDLPIDMDDIAAYAVEAQNTTYTARKGANARDLINLAYISGAVSFMFAVANPKAKSYLPYPSDWKGSVPKRIHQKRVLSKMNIPFKNISDRNDCPMPTVKWINKLFITDTKINKTDWTDIIDSIGLAVYARNSYFKA